jgi:hypothetical protein
MTNRMAHHYSKTANALGADVQIRSFNGLRTALKSGQLFRQLTAALVVLNLLPTVSMAQSTADGWKRTNAPAADMQKVIRNLNNAHSDLQKAMNECGKPNPFNSATNAMHPECSPIVKACRKPTCNPIPCPTCPP